MKMTTFRHGLLVGLLCLILVLPQIDSFTTIRQYLLQQQQHKLNDNRSRNNNIQTLPHQSGITNQRKNVLKQYPQQERIFSSYSTLLFTISQQQANKNADDDPDRIIDSNKDINNEQCENNYYQRRKLLRNSLLSAVGIVSSGFGFGFMDRSAYADESSSTSTAGVYKPAVRPTAYRVDSTQPPTLLPIATARDQLRILQRLGAGSGTDKEAIVDDTVNLNNILNKAVFGTINTVQSIAVTPQGTSTTTDSDCTFVTLGLPSQPQPPDIELAMDGITKNMLNQAIQKKPNAVAIGLTCLPYSTQSLLNDYTAGKVTNEQFEEALQKQFGIDSVTIDTYKAIWRTVQSTYNKDGKQVVDILALAPDTEDRIVANDKGLQFVNPTKRSQYVVDPSGFINQVNDPKFQLYTDRSLLKEIPVENPSGPVGGGGGGGYFAERILYHEAAATAVSKYAASAPGGKSFVTILAPIQDVRYLNGINGRIPRICNYLATTQSSSVAVLNRVNANSVTTILINPTARETLSTTKFLRLEIGTGPETIPYQTKVADYLWFSSSPKVNMLPRLMN